MQHSPQRQWLRQQLMVMQRLLFVSSVHALGVQKAATCCIVKVFIVARLAVAGNAAEVFELP
jgi:hypothetical protein